MTSSMIEPSDLKTSKLNNSSIIAPDSTLSPNTDNYKKHRTESPCHSSTVLYPLEFSQSSPLPLSNAPIRQHRSSTVSDRRTITPDLGALDAEEQAALQAEIAARRAARRASRRQMSYSEEEDEDDNRVAIGTRVSEGHRNYQLM